MSSRLLVEYKPLCSLPSPAHIVATTAVLFALFGRYWLHRFAGFCCALFGLVWFWFVFAFVQFGDG